MLPALLLLLATREIFPADFTPNACAVEVSCISFPDSSMKSAGFQFLGLDLDAGWLEKHGPEMKAAMAPLCRKHATCQTYPTNTYMFCDDVLTAEAHTLCGKLFPADKNAHDSDQCKAWIEVYLMGVDQNAINTWKTAQACTKKQPPAVHAKPLEIWMSPESIPYDYKGAVTFYAIDPDTHVPVLARVLLPNQIIYAPANPSGEMATYYPFPMPFKYLRVPNKEGHTDAIPPTITISAQGYPDTSFQLPAVVPKAIVEMTPATLHAGRNEVTVAARDSLNGKSIDGRIMMGNDEIGFTNQPIAIDVKPGAQRPEIWLKPYLDRYSDVVIVPAAK